MPKIEKDSIETWLKEQKDRFDRFLTDMRIHKLKALSPKNQGKIFASAGVSAFIKAELEYLDTLNCDVGHELEKGDNA